MAIVMGDSRSNRRRYNSPEVTSSRRRVDSSHTIGFRRATPHASTR